jgi:hypothetical protein
VTNRCPLLPARATPLNIQPWGSLPLNWCLDTLFLTICSEKWVIRSIQLWWLLSELKGRLQTAHHVAKKILIASKVRSKDYYDKGTEVMKTELGDKVLLYDETVRRCRSRKLWIGPYGGVELNKVNATIRKGRKLKNVHVNGLMNWGRL